MRILEDTTKTKLQNIAVFKKSVDDYLSRIPDIPGMLIQFYTTMSKIKVNIYIQTFLLCFSLPIFIGAAMKDQPLTRE